MSFDSLSQWYDAICGGMCNVEHSDSKAASCYECLKLQFCLDEHTQRNYTVVLIYAMFRALLIITWLICVRLD